MEKVQRRTMRMIRGLGINSLQSREEISRLAKQRRLNFITNHKNRKQNIANDRMLHLSG